MSSLRMDSFRLIKRRLEEEYKKRGKINEKISIQEFSEVCRICLSKEALQPIFELFFRGKNLKDLIEFAACVKVEKDDELPSNICLKCYTDILKASLVKEICQKSEMILKSSLQNNKEIPVKEEYEDREESRITEEEYDYEDMSEMPTGIVETEETFEETEEVNEEKVDDGYFLVFDDIDSFFQSSAEGQVNEITQESNNFESSNSSEKNSLRENMREKNDTINISISNGITSKSMAEIQFENRDHTYSRVPKVPIKSVVNNKINLTTDSNSKGLQTFEGAYIEQIKKTMGDLSLIFGKTEKNEADINTGNDYDGNDHEYIYTESTEENEEVIKCDDQEKDIFYVTSLEESEDNVESEYELLSGFDTEVKNHINVWFGCKICGKRFAQSMQLKKHIKTHSGNNDYVCEFCGKAFSQKIYLLEHLKVHDLKEEVIEENLKNHKVNPASPESICRICNITFATRYEFRSHRAQHHKEKNFLCPTCGKMFASNTSLHTHIKALHKGEKSTCEICNKTFSSYGNLKLHHSRHHSEEGRPYTCNLCLKAFVTTTDLKFHMQVHSGEKNFICQVCGKGFRLKTSYNSHTLIHTGERPHQCKICLRRFVQPTHLNYHSLTHTGERPHACQYCGKTFALKGNLTVHIRTHTGERPYVCDVCGKGFYDSSSMKKHRKGHHGEDPVIPAVLSIVNDENNES